MHAYWLYITGSPPPMGVW
ncbi:hypothetical protein Zm00014a_041876 [Zea mays]|uniref:Uncharacterized protein n=1 Tax=Zea mays TaxID=4577 RepID=A0A3L6D9E8_MAIZE|nr:hypothetical protein Zm00014a_041876 [Zea mays]